MKTNEIRGKDDSEILFDIGESEKEILARLSKVLLEIVKHECNARLLLVESDRLKLMDKIGRGLYRNAMSFQT